MTFSSEEEDEKEWQERMNQKQALQVFKYLNSEFILLFDMNGMKMNNFNEIVWIYESCW